MSRDEILERLGYDAEQTLSDLEALSPEEILEQLNEWYPDSENDTLAEAIANLN